MPTTKLFQSSEYLDAVRATLIQQPQNKRHLTSVNTVMEGKLSCVFEKSTLKVKINEMGPDIKGELSFK